MWEILFDSVFEDWMDEQEEELQDRVYAGLMLLRQFGPALPRPYADTVHGSKFPNMKELRVQHRGRPIRVFFAFDPIRHAYVVCAGDKTGDEKNFYLRMIAQADAIFQQHLDTLEK